MNRGPQEVTIHVTDEQRGVTRDVTCNRQLLVDGMAYFRSYLNGANTDDVDISVHCDVNIFEWLIRFLKNQGHSQEPKLSVRNVISILISSEFLQMDRLVTECLRFIYANMSEIVKIPIDLACINAKLMSRLAEMLCLEDLDAIDDPKDKIISRLYMCKLEEWLSVPRHMPARCLLCQQLYPAAARSLLPCAHAPLRVDVHGQLRARHQPDSSFSLEEYLTEQRLAGRSWTQIFWRIWGVAQLLPCGTCGRLAPLSYWLHCTSHPSMPALVAANATSKPVSAAAPTSSAHASLLAAQQAATNAAVAAAASSAGAAAASVLRARFPCCQRRCTQLPAFDLMSGCVARPHHVDHPTDAQKRLLETARRHADCVLEPFSANATSQSSASTRVVPSLGPSLAPFDNMSNVEYLFVSPPPPLFPGDPEFDKSETTPAVPAAPVAAKPVAAESDRKKTRKSKRGGEDAVESATAETSGSTNNSALRFETLTSELDASIYFWPPAALTGTHSTDFASVYRQGRAQILNLHQSAPDTKSTRLLELFSGAAGNRAATRFHAGRARVMASLLLNVDPSCMVHPFDKIGPARKKGAAILAELKEARPVGGANARTRYMRARLAAESKQTAAGTKGTPGGLAGMRGVRTAQQQPQQPQMSYAGAALESGLNHEDALDLDEQSEDEFDDDDDEASYDEESDRSQSDTEASHSESQDESKADSAEEDKAIEQDEENQAARRRAGERVREHNRRARDDSSSDSDSDDSDSEDSSEEESSSDSDDETSSSGDSESRPAKRPLPARKTPNGARRRDRLDSLLPDATHRRSGRSSPFSRPFSAHIGARVGAGGGRAEVATRQAPGVRIARDDGISAAAAAAHAAALAAGAADLGQAVDSDSDREVGSDDDGQARGPVRRRQQYTTALRELDRRRIDELVAMMQRARVDSREMQRVTGKPRKLSRAQENMVKARLKRRR